MRGGRPRLPPSVIGATGGSGTRVVAKVARLAGMFTGSNLNASEDNLDYAWFSDRFIDRYYARSDGRRAPVEGEMEAELRTFLEREWAALGGVERPWGWKEPRSIFLLPFLHRIMPSMRFLHVVRDGRDMALSANQNQLRKHGGSVLSPEERLEPEPVRSIRVWACVNAMAADYGERRLGPQYLRVRFEDLCGEPAGVLGRVLSFLGLEAGAAPGLASEVRAPSSLGRWRLRPEQFVRDLERSAGPALLRLGYEPGGS